MKNEEASQISRLNDEIRALKEKLMRQAMEGGAVGSGEHASMVSSGILFSIYLHVAWACNVYFSLITI